MAVCARVNQAAVGAEERKRLTMEEREELSRLRRRGDDVEVLRRATAFFDQEPR